MTIRLLGVEDLREWRRIRAEGLQLFPTAFLTTLAEERARPDSEVVAMLAQRVVFGAFDGDRLVGTAALDPVAGAAAAAHRVALNAVYVSPDHHGRGTAERLMQAALDRAVRDGRLQVELHVAGDNGRAIRFYERAGFLRHGVLPRAARIDGVFVDDLYYVRHLDG